jgi:hypothetical protein
MLLQTPLFCLVTYFLFLNFESVDLHSHKNAKLKKLSKFADISVLILLVIFFLGFLAFDYEIFGLHEQIITIPHEMEVYFEFVPWIIFIVLVFDLFLKYLIVEKNLKIFFQHYWLDVVMAALIPILLPLKFMKMTVKSFKIIKTGKFGYKANQKIGKIRQHFFTWDKTKDG